MTYVTVKTRNGNSTRSCSSNRSWLTMRQVAPMTSDGRQVGQVPLDVGVFLVVIRWLAEVPGWRGPGRLSTAAVTVLTCVCHGSYFQITYVPWPMGGISMP